MPRTPPQTFSGEDRATAFNEPTTPDLRSRWRPTPGSSPLRPGETSPTSTATLGTINSNVFDPSLHNALQSRPNVNAINLVTPTRKVFIRADPSLGTCFDPADKELYKLWAPKQ